MFTVVSPVTGYGRYFGWGHWRREAMRQERERQSRADPDSGPASTPRPFCPLCWGASYILTPAANGEGLIRELCPDVEYHLLRS